MEKLLVQIGELIATEIEEVENVEYVDQKLGYMFYINLKDGKKILLTLLDSKL